MKRGRPYKASATVMRECDSLLSEVWINTVQYSEELIYNIFRRPRQSSSSCRVDLNDRPYKTSATVMKKTGFISLINVEVGINVEGVQKLQNQ